MPEQLNGQELATILAALRYYQENGQGEPVLRTDRIHKIATDDDRVVSLDACGIDALCERLNCGESVTVPPKEVSTCDRIVDEAAVLLADYHPDVANALVDLGMAMRAAPPTDALRESAKTLADLCEERGLYPLNVADVRDALTAKETGNA